MLFYLYQVFLYQNRDKESYTGTNIHLMTNVAAAYDTISITSITEVGFS